MGNRGAHILLQILEEKTGLLAIDLQFNEITDKILSLVKKATETEALLIDVRNNMIGNSINGLIQVEQTEEWKSLKQSFDKKLEESKSKVIL